MGTPFGCPQLIDISSSGPPQNIKLSLDEFTIGRGATNSLVLPSIGISRTHCILERNNKDEWVIIDMSSNGTRVNGERIEKRNKRILKQGDVISLGESVTYLFKLPVGSSSTATNSITEDEILDAAASVIENADAFKEDIFTPSNFEEVGTSTQQLNAETVKVKVENDEASCSTAVVPKRECSSDTDDETKAKKIKLEDDTHDELQCSICTEMFFKAQTLSCSHTFCKFCIEQWKSKQNFCPICRTKITTLSSTLVIDNIIEKIIENSSKEIQDQRRAVIEERNAIPSASGSNTTNPSNNLVDPIIVSDDEYNEHDSSYWEYSSDDMDEDDEDYESDYAGGAYFGGYGRCYICKSRGHWANGCPIRRGR